MLRSFFNKCKPIVCTKKATDWMSVHSNNVQTNLPVSLSQHSFFWSRGSNKADEGLVTVYVGEQENKVYRVKTFSICSSLTGICAQPIMMHKMESLGQLILANTFIGFFAFVTPVLLHFLTKRYVTKVVYDPKTDMYTATLVTFFLTEKKVTFGPGEAMVPDLPMMLTTFKIRGIPMLVDASDFDVAHYTRILGYDKPLDYKLESVKEDPAANVTQVNVEKNKK